jgi:hypothetical protein
MMNMRRRTRSRSRTRILSVEAGQVVCPRRGLVDVERCWVCPAYDGWRFADGEAVACRSVTIDSPVFRSVDA